MQLSCKYEVMSEIANTIQEFIESQNKPTNYSGIEAHVVKNKPNINKTTIYRNLEKLEKEGFIKKVILSDHKQYWEVAQTNPTHQHYHLICQKCEKIECQELDSELAFKLINFKILKTELNLYGFCQSCI
jgi:Fur family transcriptional regulator, ferric uptake regulator